MRSITLVRVLSLAVLSQFLGCSEVIMQASSDSQVFTDAFVFPDSVAPDTDTEAQNPDA